MMLFYSVTNAPCTKTLMRRSVYVSEPLKDAVTRFRAAVSGLEQLIQSLDLANETWVHTHYIHAHTHSHQSKTEINVTTTPPPLFFNLPCLFFQAA